MRLKKWCFWIVVLEKKTLENPLDCKEVNLINPKGNHPWIFIERANAVAPKLWPPDVKSWLIEKNPLSNEKRLTGIDSWERPRAGGGGCDKGWDGWMVSPTQWTWVWVGSGSWWWEACHAAVHGVAKSRTWLSDWTERFWLCRSQQIIENS